MGWGRRQKPTRYTDDPVLEDKERRTAYQILIDLEEADFQSLMLRVMDKRGGILMISRPVRDGNFS